MEQLLSHMRRYWGYDAFLPLQGEAMRCVMEGRDSVVVLPTGGGKSLCFQAPAVAMPGLAIVISPLISLMKDQVDALRACGVAAACLNSSLDPEERRQAFAGVRRGQIKLLYAAPERVVLDGFLDWLRSVDVSFIAIDEAHCISSWGHQFRPEYRALRVLRDAFPDLGIHAYTATATERVRLDIAAQLALRAPEILVGSFDRPNLTYRVIPRTSEIDQVMEAIERHRGGSGIVYCISRKKVERLAAQLTAGGHRALPYHAGMEDEARRRNQDAFIREEAEIIVATVAFGMGIDKSNVRFVVHAAMPKSIEDYMQESGRAGRDGLEAECCLLHSDSDYMVWKRMLAELDPEPRAIALGKLGAISAYCHRETCRHRTLVRYLGQDAPDEPCHACDVCLGELPHAAPSRSGRRQRRSISFPTTSSPGSIKPYPAQKSVVPDSDQMIGQKITSCVVRLGEGWDASYTARVLGGQGNAAMETRGHTSLSTFGILKGQLLGTILGWIDELVDQGYLSRRAYDGALAVTGQGWRLLRGEAIPPLTHPLAHTEGDRRDFDAELFDKLRALRRRLADAQQMPAYIVFSDAVLREMASRRPTSADELLAIKGIGEHKAASYGPDFLALIRAHGAS